MQVSSSTERLPSFAHGFVGRDAEIDEIQHAFSVTRMLTLSGPGGIGKTRLAVETLRRLCTDDGLVAYVDLAPLTDPAYVPQAVAEALGARPSDEPLQAALDLLQDTPAVLALDNCEHLLEESAKVCEAILRACPRTRILATSREGPVVTGGSVWGVPPLAVPGADATVEQISSADAVVLFTDRARSVQPDLEMSDAMTPVIAEICHRLDGIPLAIELTASRVDILGVEQIAERLREERPASARRTSGPDRQQTLAHTIDWSYALLSDEETSLLDRLSVFAGPFGPEAVEEICTGDGIEREGVLDVLAALVRKSLVAVDRREGRVVYRLLEMIREHASARLAASCRSEELLRRHRHYYADLLSNMNLQGPGQVRWFTLLDDEYENVRKALEDGVPFEGEVAGKAVRTISYYRFVRGRWFEARRWLSGILDRVDEDDPTLRSFVLDSAGRLAEAAGDIDEARRFAELDLELSRRHGSWRDENSALAALANALSSQGSVEEAERLYEEALQLARDNDSPHHVMLAVQTLAHSKTRHGDLDGAIPLWKEGLELAGEVEDRFSKATAEKGLGDVARLRGRHAVACAHYERAVHWYRELDATHLMGTILVELASSLIGLRRLSEAEERLEEAIPLLGAGDSPSYTAPGLVLLADVRLARGRSQEARLHYQEALRISTESNDAAQTVRAIDGLGRAARVEGRLPQAVNHHREALKMALEEDDDALVVLCVDSLAAFEHRAERGPRAAALWSSVEHFDNERRGYRPPDLAGEWEAWRRTMSGDGDVGDPMPLRDAAALGFCDDDPLDKSTPDRSFCREGDVWVVTYEGETSRLRDTKGMRYLSRLLADPNQEVHVLQLVSGAARLTAGTQGSPAQEGLTSRDAATTEVLLDDEAKAAYRERLVALEDEIEEAELFADSERAARAWEELDRLKAHLASAVGLGGRDRKPTAAAERARVNVTRAIRSAIDRMADEHPLLYEHLRATVSTGTFCCYTPDPGHPVRWETSD